MSRTVGKRSLSKNGGKRMRILGNPPGDDSRFQKLLPINERQQFFLFRKRLDQLRNIIAERRNCHKQCKAVADRHKYLQYAGRLQPALNLGFPEHQHDEQTRCRCCNGCCDIGNKDQLCRRSVIDKTDHTRERQAGHTSPADDLGLQRHILIKSCAQKHHSPLGISKQ